MVAALDFCLTLRVVVSVMLSAIALLSAIVGGGCWHRSFVFAARNVPSATLKRADKVRQ